MHIRIPPELLVYNRILTPGERRKAESYLAMKYGVTLNDSYLDGDGNLVWDRDEAGVYHNRVTAISRNKAGDFLQPMSATSYEEGPLYTSLPENDSYHKSNSYGLPSEAHLLVMGREYGNPMPDKLSLFWGDDGGALDTYTSLLYFIIAYVNYNILTIFCHEFHCFIVNTFNTFNPYFFLISSPFFPLFCLYVIFIFFKWFS